MPEKVGRVELVFGIVEESGRGASRLVVWLQGGVLSWPPSIGYREEVDTLALQYGAGSESPRSWNWEVLLQVL